MLYVIGIVLAAVLLRAAYLRLLLSRAKHRSLEGHSRIARRLASWVPYYEYGPERFFQADDAPPEVATSRRDGFQRLAALYAQRFPKSAALTAEAAQCISDLQFTSRYRVPFQFSRLVREHLRAGTFLAASSGPTVTDLDGNRLYDLTGSYGVNLFGYDLYKECIERGSARVRDLGPVLGA